MSHNNVSIYISTIITTYPLLGWRAYADPVPAAQRHAVPDLHEGAPLRARVHDVELITLLCDTMRNGPKTSSRARKSMKNDENP